MDNRMSLLTSPFVPAGMVDLMKKLSKGVIKERPSNIYEYAADFFEKMLIERDGSLDKGYGKFRSYTEYCKFMDKMDQRRLSETTKKVDEIADSKDTTDFPQEAVVPPSNIEVQGVAIQGVERKSKDSVRNVSINPKYKSQSEKTAKPVASSVKNVKAKPRKLSSKKPSENLIVIKEETSADVDDSGNGESKLHNAAMTIQKAFRMYMSKKSSQGEQSSDMVGNVSQLSEDAAAVIIQKAFKSLIQKLKPETQNRGKAADESNNNIVIPGAGQENPINVDKLINNTDEHSEQILDGTGTKHELERKDTLHEVALEDTATNSEIETNAATNLEMLTAVDAARTQQIETEEMFIKENESTSDVDNNQAAIASDDNYKTGHNEDSALQQENELPIHSTTIPLNMKTEKDEIPEATDPSVTLIDEEVQLKEGQAMENDLVHVEVQPSENDIAVTRSENLKSSDTPGENVSHDPINPFDQNDTEVIKHLPEAARENKSNLSDDEDVSKITSESKQDDSTVPLNSSGTTTDVDHSINVRNNEIEIVPSEKQKIVTQLETTAQAYIEPTSSDEPSENTSNISSQKEDPNYVTDNIEKNSSADNNPSDENVPESPVKQQLFVVEKDGIYVDMDVLQEKFGTTAIDTIDDGTGSGSEKTFKLNILEREEILVNQENVQHIKDEELATNNDIVDKSLIMMADESKKKVVDEVESTEASNCDIRDEDGNEEYELAETVVLMDIPSKSYPKSENVLPTVDSETEFIDTMKMNKLTDELDKLESYVDGTSLEVLSDSVKIMDKQIDQEVAQTTADLGEVIKNEAAIEKLEIIEEQSNKIENPESMSNLDDESIKERNSEEKVRLENTEYPTIENESPASEEIVKTKVAYEVTETEIEKVESQLKPNELPEFQSEIIMKAEPVEEEQTNEEKVDSQSNKSELPASQSEALEDDKDEKLNGKLNKHELSSARSEKVEAVNASGEPRNDTVEGQLNRNEVTAPESETIAMVELQEAKNENVENRCNETELISTNSEKIVKLEVDETKDENERQLTSSETENVVKVEAVKEIETRKLEDSLAGNELQVADSILKVENVEDDKNKAENVDTQLNKGELTSSDKENIAKVEEIESEKVEDQMAGNELQVADSIVKVGNVEDETTKKENVDSHVNKSGLMSSDKENIVKVEPVEVIETEKVGDRLNVKELQAIDSGDIGKVEVLEGDETKSDLVDSQSNKIEKLPSEPENFVKSEVVTEIATEQIENQLDVNESQVTDFSKNGKRGAALEGDDTKLEKERQLDINESKAAVSSSENDSTKVGEFYKANYNSEDKSASPQVKEETHQPVAKSEGQLQKDKDNNGELEPDIYGKDDEVVQEEMENAIHENSTTSLTNDKIDLPKTEDESEKTDTGDKENEELVKAATIIQKVFRGYIVRNSTTSKPNSRKDQPELWAALIIQKYARGYLVRSSMQKVDKLRTSQVASNQMKNNESDTSQTADKSKADLVPQLPAYSNRFLIPKDSFLERESFADDEDYARTCKELAATSIQKTYRGYRVRRSLKASSENDAETEEDENGIDLVDGRDQVQTVVTEADRVISDVLNVAADVLPLDTYDLDSFEDEVTDEKTVELRSPEISIKPTVDPVDSALGQQVHDNIHVEGQMQQKYNQIKFRGTSINPIEEMSDSFEQPETPREKAAPTSTLKSKTIESDSLDSKDYDGSKSFSYEQLSSDLSDTDENKRESMKESEVDETSRDERDDLSEVENFDLSSCGEDSLEAMYYSLRKNEIMVDRMHKQVAEQREPKNNEVKCEESENLKVEFPERVTENLDVAMQQVFKSMESSSDYDVGKKDEDDNSSTLDLALDDSSSINDEKEIETTRHIKQMEEENLEDSEQSESTTNAHEVSQSPEPNMDRDVETSNVEQSQQSDSSTNSVNSSTRFIMKSQSVSEDMMNPIMFAMKRKQALLDQMHVRPYPLQENLSEDHDAFPEHLLTDIDIGNIQRKIFASSVSETDSDYIEPNTTSRRLVRDDFNISTALDHLSTDSDSTIISAATKIQAGARGFLTRRRLRRSSAGGTSISFEKRYSFGNAAIDKSLEDLIKMQEQINLDGAALKIQQQYRRYQARKNNLKKVSPIREQTTLELSGGSSVEGNEGTDDMMGIREITLAQKKVDECQDTTEEERESRPISLNIDTVETVQAVRRTPVNQRRLTLQRGDAVQRNSRPDSPDLNVKDGDISSKDNQTNEKCKDSETGEYIDTTNTRKEKKVTAYINIQSLINRGIGPRQRSMPVQIDSELMRIIPKHLRKRVKSADMAKKRSG